MEIQVIMDSLRKVLKLKGVSFLQLAQALGITERSLTNVFSGKGLSVERLLKICDLIGISITELTQMGEAGLEHMNFLFSEEQEEFLANNWTTGLFYSLLFTYGSVKKLAKDYNIDDVTVGKILANLEKINLLKWLPGNEVELYKPRKFNSHGGPIYKAHGEGLGKQLFDKSFNNNKEPAYLFFPNLSEHALKKFRVKIKELYLEIKKEREMETLLKLPTETVGVLLCLESFKPDYEELRNLRL